MGLLDLFYFCLFTLIPSCGLYRYLNVFLLRRKIINPYAIKIIGTCHASVATIVSLLYLRNYLTFSLFCWLARLNSLGYFFLDISHLVLYRQNTKTYPVKSYFLHHLVCLLGLYYIRYFPQHFGWLYLTEVTTPFINLSWFFNYHSKPLYLKYYFINGLITWLLFFWLRVYNPIDIMLSPSNKPYIIFYGLLTPLTSLNIVWFLYLTRLYCHDYLKFKDKI